MSLHDFLKSKNLDLKQILIIEEYYNNNRVHELSSVAHLLIIDWLRGEEDIKRGRE